MIVGLEYGGVKYELKKESVLYVNGQRVAQGKVGFVDVTDYCP